ncbi:MAG: PAS domain-containing protein [Bacteroidetes bacterium]|nr:PAS domain-containing protein [Bacteroidota bacterium]
MELTESAEILKLIIDGTNAGIWDWDFESGEVYWSENFYGLLGYKQGDIPARIETFYELLHPEDKMPVAQALNAHLKYGEPYRVVARLKTKQAKYKYFECTGKAVFEDGKAIRMAGCNIDIHERKVLENKLAESEYLLSEAGRLARMGGWEYNLLTNKSIWSKTVFDIYELPYDHNLEFDNPYSYFLPPYDEMMKKAVEETAAHGIIWDLELQMLTERGKVIWVRSYGEPVYGRSGAVEKLRGVFMDIEKYKTNEIALNNSIDVMTQNNLQLKNFTHILSHNIRNHANNISLLTSFVDTAALDEENADLIQRIVKVSQGLNSTLDDLSEAIRIQESELISDTLKFEEVINGVLDVLGTDLEANETTVKKELWTEQVAFPRLYLESIIMNLVTNAVKYRKPDVPPVITLRTYTNHAGSVVLECQDNGIGIDLEIHGKKIFGLYKTFHDRKDAHGVGLFLSKTQVESQGGQISVESEPNLGSTFRVTFKARN